MDNMLYIGGKALISKFIITFSYTTKRGNEKIREVKLKSTSKAEAECYLYNWVDSYNKKYNFRAYSNVKILECKEIDREVILL